MRVRVATLNVWGLPYGISRALDARFEAIGARLADLPADVVALQEVWTRDGRTKLVAAGRDAGLTHVWHNEAARGGSGLVVLSRIPFVSVPGTDAPPPFRLYRARGLVQRIWHGDYFSGKGFSLLGLATTPGPTVLVDTHLHARYVPSSDEDDYLGHRTAQVLQLARALASIRAPVIALGDFNLAEGETEYAILTGTSGLRDVAARLDRRRPTALADHPYRRPGDPEARIDYVFTRDGSDLALRPHAIERIWDEEVEIDGGPGRYSDHAGLLSEIEIGQATPEAWRIEPAALDAAARNLARGRREAESRRRGERWIAAATAAGGAGAWLASGQPALSRRHFMRRALRAASGVAAVRSLAGVALAEVFVPEELAAFDAAERDLAALRAGPRAAAATLGRHVESS